MITYDIYNIQEEIEKFARLQLEHKEKTLAELIAKYDFIVGSEESKCKLMEVLPEGANIVCSPYIEDSKMIYAIKRFNVMDLLINPDEQIGIGRGQLCSLIDEPQESEVNNG